MICKQCATADGYGGCCKLLSMESKFHQMPITVRDAERVAIAAGMRPDFFVQVDSVLPRVKKYFSSVSNFFDKQTPGGVRLKLRTELLTGECALLIPGEGCCLDEGSRPTVCRMFPFWWPDLLDPSRVEPILASPSSCLAIFEAQGDSLAIASLVAGPLPNDHEAIKAIYNQALEDTKHHRKNLGRFIRQLQGE